jgi:membrane protease YdiL (CAAX protease family)
MHTSTRPHRRPQDRPNKPIRAEAQRPPQPDDPALRPLVALAAVALPVGWLLLSLYQVLELPPEPFVLATLAVGLLAPALVLSSRRRGGPGVSGLFRDAVRLPRSVGSGVFALLAIPVLVWATASALGHGTAVDGSLLVAVAVNVVSSALIINIWEEMVWTGFVQRRAMARWGLVAGSTATAVLFAGLHLPLAFDGASSAGEVLVGVGYLFATGIGLRLLVACVDSWSGRSLLTIGLLHASFNASAELVDPSHDWVRYLVTVLLGVLMVAATSAVRREDSTAGGRR